MIASRTFSKSVRVLRSRPIRVDARYVRLQSNTSQQSSGPAKIGGSSGLIGGIAGGALVFTAGYGYYYFSGAKTIFDTAKKTKDGLSKVAKSVQEKAPEPNELLRWFRQVVNQWAGFIPGAQKYADSVFNSLEKIEEKHRDEVNDVLSNAYEDMKAVSKGDLSIDNAQKGWEILEKCLKQLSGLASDSASEILDNYPELKKKVGGNLEQLKSMANAYGPEAKKELDQTYDQIKDAVTDGIGMNTIEKVRRIMQEKMERIRSIGDEAWKKGTEKAKPFLDKNPKTKELLEKNKDALKSSNMTELFSKLSEGNPDSVKQYIQQVLEKASQGGIGTGVGKNIEQYVKMIPGGDIIIPKLKQLQEVATQKGDEVEKVVRETYDEVAEVLQKKTKEIEKLADKAQKGGKK